MKKIKISELPLYSSLKGLFTIGTDANNRSVKVSLEFVEEQTTEAVKNATTATAAAKTATTEAEKATDAAKTATEEAQAATGEAKTATDAANKATSDVLAAFAGLIPSSLTVKYNERLTLGNIQPVYITAELMPEGTLKNVIFLSDNKAVTVNPDGRVQIVAKGRSVIHVIPTCNTAIAKTIAVTVEEPTMRLVNTRSQMRFTQSGGIRLN
jgi:autotransporter translocation and assembly factor TamB